MSGADEELDKAIAALELLATRLEAAPAGELPTAFVEAAGVSAAVVDDVVEPSARAAWHASLNAALAGTCTDTYARSVSARSEEEGLAKKEAVARGSACAACGAGLGEEEQERRRDCVHRCGVMFCGVECWRKGRRRHAEEGCDVLRRRRMLKRVGLASVDEEFF
jgi:hypothetical protein